MFSFKTYLLEKLLTNQFKIGFELEAIAKFDYGEDEGAKC